MSEIILDGSEDFLIYEAYQNESTATWEELHPPGWQKEAVVSLQTAKLAKEKGFHWYVNTLYNLGTFMECPDQFGTPPEKDDWNDKHEDYQSAPTLAFLQQWFRDKHKVFIEVSVDQTTQPKYAFEICHYTKGDWHKVESDVNWSLYRTYDSALEVALNVALRKL